MQTASPLAAPISGTGATAALPPALANTPSAGKSNINPDFDTFLKMLTTQMQNQDPMNPMDSSQYAVQLATFSGVEQQTRTNQLLQSLLGQVGSMGMAQLAGWVGMEARSTAPARFDGSPITLAPEARAGADRAVLVVKDASGTEISRSDVKPGADTMDWAGTDAQGSPLANGIYSFSLESYQDGVLMGADPVASYSRVTEARIGADGTTSLVLDSGAEVSSSDVTALRAGG